MSEGTRAVHQGGWYLPPVRFRRLPHGEGLLLPAYATDGAAGMDLRAAVDCRIDALSTQMVPTGFAIAVPAGYEGQVRLRSSVGRQGLVMPNAPGTIDSDYRGEIFLLLRNLTLDTLVFERGQRIGQLVIAPVARLAVREVAELDDTVRGIGGFGSTGVA